MTNLTENIQRVSQKYDDGFQPTLSSVSPKTNMKALAGLKLAKETTLCENKANCAAETSYAVTFCSILPAVQIDEDEGIVESTSDRTTITVEKSPLSKQLLLTGINEEL